MFIRKANYLIVAFLLNLCSLGSMAQSNSKQEEGMDEYKRKVQSDMNKFTDHARQDLDQFRANANSEYYRFLKNAWIELQSNKPVKSYKVPKPNLPPSLGTPEKQIKHEPEPVTEPAPNPHPIDIIPNSVNDNREKIDFYSLVIGAPIPSPEWPQLSAEINNNTIADYWQRASKCNMANWLAYVAAIKDTVGGGDYAVYRVVNKIAGNYYKNPVTARLFCWYSLMQNGFDVKIGYTKHNVYLLIYSQSEIFGRDYFNINNKKYYTLDEEAGIGEMHICAEDCKLTSHTLNPDIKPALNLKSGLASRKFAFNFHDKNYEFEFSYCPQHINYLFLYPQLTYSDYLASEPGEWFDRQFQQEFKPILNSMSEYDGIQFLLSFVQHAFEYQDDITQFGREKWYFPEEILKYPYSDCDDRAIFFGYLVKKLTGHKVIGLLYENHICTAVRFNQHVDGDKIFYKNEHFMICDPTYVGAAIGKSMPEYKNAVPKIYE